MEILKNSDKIMSNRAILSPNLLHARIQQYQTVPRDKGAIAKTDTTAITQGSDGRTYRLLNNDDSKVITLLFTHALMIAHSY